LNNTIGEFDPRASSALCSVPPKPTLTNTFLPGDHRLRNYRADRWSSRSLLLSSTWFR